MNLNRFDFQSYKIMASLDSAERATLKSESEKLSFKKGKLIFYDSGIPTGVFLLEKGMAKIFKTGPYGKDQIFYIYKAGDLFGYHALLCHENYEDSCEALEDCEIRFIRRRKFETLLTQVPRLKNLIIQNMGHEFGVLVNTITIMAQKPLRERLALHLLILHDRYDDGNQVETTINLPREDLANIIGASRESLGRLLKEFKEEGLIRVNKRKITLANYSQLVKLASD